MGTWSSIILEVKWSTAETALPNANEDSMSISPRRCPAPSTPPTGAIFDWASSAKNDWSAWGTRWRPAWQPWGMNINGCVWKWGSPENSWTFFHPKGYFFCYFQTTDGQPLEWGSLFFRETHGSFQFADRKTITFSSLLEMMLQWFIAAKTRETWFTASFDRVCMYIHNAYVYVYNCISLWYT